MCAWLVSGNDNVVMEEAHVDNGKATDHMMLWKWSCAEKGGWEFSTDQGTGSEAAGYTSKRTHFQASSLMELDEKNQEARASEFLGGLSSKKTPSNNTNPF